MDRITYGVGSHEPIWHRLRTGHAAADEWQRWQRETDEANLDLLAELGVTTALIACTKGFGLQYEKPLIERAARFAESAGGRGIAVNVYVQGFPVYYETFLLEVPEAEAWLARSQAGEYVPWGGQTFRRWMDPTRGEFHEYQFRLLTYVLEQFKPAAMFMDNTVTPLCYTDSARESFRAYLRREFDGSDPERLFGIQSFDAVDLPRFDPVYFPRDAYRIVKDPLLQEWAFWRSRATADFLTQARDLVHRLSPGTTLHSGCGCDGLRYNQLFVNGVDFDDRIAALDHAHMEESGWRPAVVEPAGGEGHVVHDGRNPDQTASGARAQVRISTDSRWWKICSNYGWGGHGGFWGETDRAGKLVALSHNWAFARDAADLGTIGPLAAHRRMLDDLAEAIAWGNAHVGVLTRREDRFAPVGVWRSTATLGFIRHRPVWQACAVEQLLYEHHVPFTILLDGSLERFLARPDCPPAGRKVLVLPGAACVSDRQVEAITGFVRTGGGLLLLGESGTRDERTRIRRRFAFEGLFGGTLPDLEQFGPPHWVPELDFSAMPERASARFGEGRVALVKRIVPVHEPDLSRDPYMPERQVMPKDVVPPANEQEILEALLELLGACPRVDGPRWTLCEYWRRGRGLLVCCANLHRRADGGPITVNLGSLRASVAKVHSLADPDVRAVPVRDGTVRIESVKHFCAVEIEGALQ